MKLLILLTVTTNFFNLIHRSTEECTTKTDCIPPNQSAGTPIEIGIIYDLYEDEAKVQAVSKLHEIACQVISEFGSSLTFKRYPGASVVATDNGITCADDCFRNREDACCGIVVKNYFTECSVSGIPIEPLKTCLKDFAAPDAILKPNGELRCNQGIPVSKIPALMFNKVYDPCNDFSSADQLKKFLCSTFGQALKGKGC